MSASEHLHPVQLRSLAQQHGQKFFKNFDNPDCRSTGMCYDYSDHFIEHGGLGDNPRIQEYGNDDFSHAAVHVDTTRGPYIVDFTSIQFAPELSTPLVLPRSRYEKVLAKKVGPVERGVPYPEQDPRPGSEELRRRGPSDPMRYSK